MKNFFEIRRLHAPAFTMIELLIAMIIIAILSISIVVNFNQGALKARFDGQIQKLTHGIQEARTYSLNNFLIEVDGVTESTEYYSLVITADKITLEAHGLTVSSILEEVELTDEFTITATVLPQSIFYVPPYGSIYIQAEDSGITEFEFTVKDNRNLYQETISINVQGGYPELDP